MLYICRPLSADCFGFTHFISPKDPVSKTRAIVIGVKVRWMLKDECNKVVKARWQVVEQLILIFRVTPATTSEEDNIHTRHLLEVSRTVFFRLLDDLICR